MNNELHRAGSSLLEGRKIIPTVPRANERDKLSSEVSTGFSDSTPDYQARLPSFLSSTARSRGCIKYFADPRYLYYHSKGMSCS